MNQYGNDQKMSALDQFLQSVTNKNTHRSYLKGLTHFLEFVKKPIEQVLEERKANLTPKPNESIVDAKQRNERFERQVLEPFYQSMLANGYKPNSAAKYCNGIMRLMAYYAMPIVLRNGSPISEGNRQIGLSRFPLKIKHVRQLYWAEKNLEYKLILSLAVDFPARIEDFLNIQVSELPDLTQTPPIEFMRLSTKESQLQKSCLSALTVQLLKEYISVYNPKTWLFFGLSKDANKQLSADSLNRELKRLAQVCHIQTKPYSLSFHCFRDLVLSAGKDASINEDVLKLITGKSVSKAMLPYMKTLDIRKPFTELQKVLRIDGARV
jgi:integrase